MKTKRIWKLTSCLFILSFLFQCSVFADSQGNGPELAVKSAKANAGQTAVADIVINRPNGLKTFEFTLHYDPEALEITDRDVAKGKDVGGWLFEHKVDAANGTIRFAAVNGNGFKSNSPAVIASLTFKAVGAAGDALLRVTDLKAYKEVNAPADIGSRTGTFTIKADTQPKPAPNGDPSKGGESDWGINVSVDDEASETFAIDDSKPMSVTIKVEAPHTSNSLKLNLESEAVNQLAESGKRLAIQTPIGNLMLDSKTIADMLGTSLTIDLERVDGTGHKPSVRVTIAANGETLTSLNGKVKVHVPYSKQPGEAEENIIVYHKVDGQNVIVPQASAVDGEVAFLLPETGMYEIGYSRKTFSDTSEHWSRTNIDFVTARELFVGIDAQRFAPEQSVTRGMLVTVLGRMLNLDVKAEESSKVFKDVDADMYYAPYIAFASEHGIVSGEGNGNFAPDRSITREELATIMASFMKHVQISSPLQIGKTPFKDSQQIAEWAAASVGQLQEAGILDGKTDNRFDPKSKVTRAEAAKVVRLLLEVSVQTD